MKTILLDGKVLAATLREKLASEVAHLKSATGQVPRVVSVMVGDDPAGLSYVSSQQKAADSLGIHYEVQHLAATTSQDDVLEFIEQLNAIPTDDVPITAQVTGLENVSREDIVKECDKEIQRKIIEQFPERERNLLKVKAVFKE